MKTKTFNVSRALRNTTSRVHPVSVSMKTESNRLLNGDIAVAKILPVFRLKIIEEMMPVSCINVWECADVNVTHY